MIYASKAKPCAPDYSECRSDEREQTPRVVHEDRIDLAFGEIAPHQRDDVLEDVPVAVPSIFHEARLVADVVRDQDAVEEATVGELAQGLQPHAVVRHVYLRRAPIVGRLLPEQIELHDAAGIGQSEEALVIEDGAVEVAQDGARRISALGTDQIHDLLRLIGIASRMDVERGAGLGLSDDCAAHDPLLQVGPLSLTADLPDDAGADVGAPSPLEHLRDDLLSEALDAFVLIPGILVLLDVIAAADDDRHIRRG